MRFIVDIDDTLIKTTTIQCKHCSRLTYVNPEPIKDEIESLNELYNNGHIIILNTGRGWDMYEKTKEQLEMFGIMHHELVMGKPYGISIDKTMNYNSLKVFSNGKIK